MTTGIGAEMPAVIDEPVRTSVSEPAVSVRVDWNARVCVEAPTVITHGARCSVEDAAGPSLPADAATVIPALYASRNANSVGSPNGLVPPPTEKLMTSTPSRIACATAAEESEGKQPASPQTLYPMTHAPGATPLMRPRSTPKTGVLSTMLPAAVLVVCVP